MALFENKNIAKRIALLLLFYGINFGLWEILVKFMPNEWASFSVYFILFFITIELFRAKIKEAWTEFKHHIRESKAFFLELAIAFAIYGVLMVCFTWMSKLIGSGIITQNSDNVGKQLELLPIFTVIQTCIFAPIIEEMTFRYAIIGEVYGRSKWITVMLAIFSIILFDAIHIYKIQEFLYYITPAIVLTGFYIRRKNVFATIILHSLLNVIGTIALFAM